MMVMDGCGCENSSHENMVAKMLVANGCGHKKLVTNGCGYENAGSK